MHKICYTPLGFNLGLYSTCMCRHNRNSIGYNRLCIGSSVMIAYVVGILIIYTIYSKVSVQVPYNTIVKFPNAT